MKKNFKMMALLLAVMFMLPSIVKATDEEYYVNREGVIFDEANYTYLVDTLGEMYVEFMSQNEYDGLKDQTLSLVSEDSIYIESYELGGIPMDVIVPSVSPQAVSGLPDSHTTTAKRLSLLVYQLSTNLYYATATNEWVRLPSVRVFDIFAMRVDSGFSVVDGSQQGTQCYGTENWLDAITYQYNGTNTMRFSNGFGMSMNLVDNTSITQLYNRITARLNGNRGDVQVSYQHAINSSVTRAQSMNYYLDVNGMGGAVMFNNGSMFDKYDGMMGVYYRLR